MAVPARSEPPLPPECSQRWRIVPERGDGCQLLLRSERRRPSLRGVRILRRRTLDAASRRGVREDVSRISRRVGAQTRFPLAPAQSAASVVPAGHESGGGGASDRYVRRKAQATSRPEGGSSTSLARSAELLHALAIEAASTCSSMKRARLFITCLTNKAAVRLGAHARLPRGRSTCR